jgi:2-dehydropantoate 2-reductase
MRYVIIGAGAVGGTIGARLHQRGYPVTLVARGEHLSALRRGGLRFATRDGEQVLPIPAVAGPDPLTLEPDTVLVLTVKSQHTAAAVEAWADTPVRGGGVAGTRLPLLCAQNGVANERVALRWFARVYPVCVWLPATFLTPGTVVAEGYPRPGVLHLGGYPDGADGLAHAVAEDLSASGFLAPVHEDVMRWKYGKLLGNLGNGLDALFGDALSGDASFRDGVGERLPARVRAEGATVLAAAGIGYTSAEEEAPMRQEVRTRAPVPGHPSGRSSTRQSLTRGSGSTEVDYLNGEIVLLGREHGVPTPVNAAVRQAVRRATRTGMAPGTYPLDDLLALIPESGREAGPGAGAGTLVA